MVSATPSLPQEEAHTVLVMNKKQTTLFQSWSNKGNSVTERNISSNPQPSTSTSIPQPSTLAVCDDVIDLCASFEDEDDDLLCEAEESVTNISKNVRPSAATSYVFNNDMEQRNKDEITGLQPQHACDISVGANSFTLTQAQTQSSSLPGFDKCAGKLWIYPTNYPLRDYQFNIVQQALFKNTMVTLPTGLGKTFIAAVVMYNFYRWYPQGKVIFMAPTKPLVAQQIEACYNIMGIPQNHTSELTGTMGPSKREKEWHDKRVFFLTPQVMTNDLSRGSCPALDVKCLVIDEAHKAVGNHAYCQVVKELVKYTENFRILSLSATPGSDINAVQLVLNNLLISQIEIRTEESIDIKRYSHERKVEKVVVPLGDELTKVKVKYIQIMEVVVNRLKRQGVLYNRETTSLSKFLILKAREGFRQNPPEKLQKNQYGILEGDFALAMSLYHGYELLQLHGSRSLYNFLGGILTGDKSYGRTRSELTRNADFNELMRLLSGKYKTAASETASQARAKPFVIGHPKMEKLQEIVLDHFNTHTDATTRVMIFSQYRDSVQEITDMLHIHHPVIKVMSFIGQATSGKSTKGFTQKEQLMVMARFRDGGYNTLVSTCVGEEGLDIGDVDLIICFDAHKSPIRLVQRMGRTGRKREGRIVMLVTQGKEEQIYNQSQYAKKSIHKAILNGAKSLHFYQHSPRMLPDNLTPTCHKMHLTVKENFKPTKKLLADKDPNQSKITTMMSNASSKNNQSEEIITLNEYKELEPWLVPEKDIPKLQSCHMVCLEKEGQEDHQEAPGRWLSLSEWTPWQNMLQDTERVDHSLATRHFVQIMEFVQLQHSLDLNDDAYGLEMAAYLNEEDIVRPGETDAHSVLAFGISKQITNQTHGVNRGNTKIGKSKTGRTSKLAKFNFLEEKYGESSDDDLPAFNIGDVGMEKDNHEESPVDLNKIHKTDYQTHTTDDRTVAKVLEQLTENTGNEIDDHEITTISEEEESCMAGVNIVRKEILTKRSSNVNNTLMSKARSLERRMAITKVRKPKKSRHTSRIEPTSVIELITDTDSNDFDNAIPEVSTVLKDAQKVNRGGVENAINHQIQNISHGSSSEFCTMAETVKKLSAGSYRIRTPPPIEDAVKLCEALDSEMDLVKVDLVTMIDEWHMENKEGKYLVYPESIMNESMLVGDYTTSNIKCRQRKLSVPIADIKVNMSYERTENPNERIASQSDTDVPIEHKSFLNENNTCENKLTGMAVSRKSLSMQSIINYSGTYNSMNSSSGSTVMNKELHISITDKSREKQILNKSVQKPYIMKFDDDNDSGKEDDEFMCTGNFMLNADDLLLTKDDSLDEEIYKDHCDKTPDRLVPFGQPNSVMNMDNCPNVCETESDSKIRLGEKIVRDSKEEACMSDLLSNDELLIAVEKDGFKKNRNIDIASSSDESVGYKDIPVPFSNVSKSNYDSFLVDNMDDDLFMNMKTPVANKPLETSTQITFTQALAFVHSGSRTSGSESCNETNRTYSSKKLKEVAAEYVNNTGGKNGIIEVVSPKFSVKKLHSLKKARYREQYKMIESNHLESGDDEFIVGGKNTNDKPLNEIHSEYRNFKRRSLSSEDEVEMPKFDLGFDFDEDIIPPSPEATQQSQKSTSNRLSQAFAFTNRSTVLENSEKTENMKLDQQVEFTSCLSKIPKSKKSLNLYDIRTEVCAKPKQRTDEEESQSILVDIVRNTVKQTNRKSHFNIGISNLAAVQEYSEDDAAENLEFNTTSNVDKTDSKNANTKQESSHKIEMTINHANDATIEQIEVGTGTFETSFALLGEDLDDWIDSGAAAQIKENEETISVFKDGKKLESKTYHGDENSSEAFSMKSSINILASVRRPKVPVVSVSPINYSQEFKEQSLQSLNKKGINSRSKTSRKSIFQVDDFSPDAFEDSFSFTSEMLLNNNTPKTSSNLPRNTSTPVITHTPVITPNRKVQSVSPFRQTSTNIAENHSVPKSDRNITQSRITAANTSVGYTEMGEHEILQNNSKEEILTDNDGSFIVRRKKKVQLLHSPLSQRECDKRESETDTVDNLRVENAKEYRCSKYVKKKRVLSFSSNDSDNDFDDSMMLSKNSYITRKAQQPGTDNSSDEDFEESVAQPKKQLPWKSALKGVKSNAVNTMNYKADCKRIVKSRCVMKQKRTSNPFIDEEADEDSDASTDEEDGSDLDVYEGSFISDSQSTQVQALNQTDVHAFYLKSVKSPPAHRGGFKLQFNHRTDIDVFSQRPPPEESHYMEDSFCVGSEEEEDGWLGMEEEGESEEELREVNTMQNSLQHTGRKLRRKGLQAFQTSRQRSIQISRMKALNELRSKLTSKTTITDRKRMTRVSSSEDEIETLNVPKRSRILVHDASSSDEVNKLSMKNSHFMSPKLQSIAKAKKRSRLIVSSDDSDGEHFYEGSRSMCKSNKSARIVNRNVIETNTTGKSVPCDGDCLTADMLRQERLQKQKEKQAEYRKKMDDRKIMPNKDMPKSKSVLNNELTIIKEKAEPVKAVRDDEFEFTKPVNDDKHCDTEILINSSMNKSKFSGKPVVLVDSKEISGSQEIISDLRFKHDIIVSAAQLLGCDYIVSNRMAIERKQWSEFSNGANRAKLIERMQHLGELYDRPCLIVENDRVKPGKENCLRPVHWTKYVDRTISMLLRSDFKVLYTDNYSETAALLADLCRLEQRKNMTIDVPVELYNEQMNRLKFFVSIPKLSYVNALNLCASFRSLVEFLKSSAALIESRGKMSKNRAVDVHKYVRRKFDSNMLPT